MPQLLLELFSEEIPARMQKRAEEDLARAFGEKLKAHGLEAKGLRTFSTPRRLGLVADDLPAKAADVREEKKGPRVGAPDQAVQGFLKSAGLKSIDEAQIVEDKKGAFYVARIERAGRATPAIVAEITPEIVRAFPWPKSMRSGSSDLQWVRPLHNVLCIFDGAPVKIEIDGVASRPETWGHRFHAPEAILPKDAADHAARLRAARVLIDREERKRIILDEAKKLCAAKKLELVEDAGLLEEVAGLVEWPVVLLGDMDAAFLDLPGEAIRLSMRTHQKYFAVRAPKTGRLAPHFIVVANVEAKDGGKAIAAGNARVLSARLNDARFFWDTDGKTPLYTDARRDKLKQIVFHQKLGSVWDKVERVKALAVELCAVTGADKALVERAALLCKMDLVTETVGEFPELQGQVGRQLYLAEASSHLPLDGGGGREAAGGGARAVGENRASRGKAGNASGPHPLSHASRDSSPIEGERESIAAAIEDHYRPLGPNDRVPTDPVSVTLALADKLDTLVGFWAIDEKPTGSRDAYGLRRAALGVVRAILLNSIRLALRPLLLAFVEGRIERARARVLDKFGSVFDDWDEGEEGSADLGVRYFEAAIQEPFLGPVLTRMMPEGTLSRALLEIAGLTPPDVSFEEFTKEREGFQLAYLAIDIMDSYFDLLRDSKTRSYIEIMPLEDQALYEKRYSIMRHVIERDVDDLLAFLADRLNVQLREQGKRHDLVDAVFALGDDDLVRIVARVEALDAFLKTEDGANLLAGYKRAANILAAEEKKGRGLSDSDIRSGLEPKLLTEPAERSLFTALEKALPEARAAVQKEEFAAAMKALSQLRAPVDAFFDAVLVNAEDANLRRNRLLLLSRLREALSQVADFSKIEG